MSISENPDVAAASAAVARLAELETWRCSSTEVFGVVDAATAMIAQLEAVRAHGVADLESRGDLAADGAKTAKQWAACRLHLGSREAARLQTVGTALVKGRLPAVTEALASGSVSFPHAGVVASMVQALPPSVDLVEVDKAERTLVRYARQFDPAGLYRIAQRLRCLLDPSYGDTLAHEEDVDEKTAQLWVSRDDAGRMFLKGMLGPIGAEIVATALDPLAAPNPAADGTPDPRTGAQRYADALVQLARGATGRPRLSVTIDYEVLAGRAAGLGESGWGTTLSPTTVRQLACDAGIIPILLGTDSVPLDVGREVYAVTGPLRAALVARDKTCTWDGCTRPAPWTHVHHVVHWANGGPTSLENLALLCGHHHRVVHRDKLTLTRCADGTNLWHYDPKQRR